MRLGFPWLDANDELHGLSFFLWEIFPAEDIRMNFAYFLQEGAIKAQI